MDSAFFWLSKLLWMVVAPGSLLVLCALIGWIAVLRGYGRVAKWSLSLLISAMLVISIYPIGHWMLMPLETRFETNPKLPEHIDGIIVLSGSENTLTANHWQQTEFGATVDRNLAFLALGYQYPEAKMVFTGGTGNLMNQHLKQADVAKQLYIDLNFDISRIQFETQARNTAENAKLTKQLIQPKADEVWLLVTTAWHMPRSVGLFCKLDWSVTPYPVDHWTLPDSVSAIPVWSFTRHLQILDMATKEWLGLLSYYLLGKTPALLPDKC